jgi:hypothetical protein
MKNPLEKQLLLTKFCKKGVNNSSETTNTNSDDFLSNNANKALLENELKKKNEIIQSLQTENKN